MKKNAMYLFFHSDFWEPPDLINRRARLAKDGKPRRHGFDAACGRLLPDLRLAYVTAGATLCRVLKVGGSSFLGVGETQRAQGRWIYG